MTPIETAQAIWQIPPCLYPFWVDVMFHLQNGLVIATPSVFLLARAVKHDAPQEQIADAAVRFVEPDAWFLNYGGSSAGLQAFFDCEPHPYPFIGWGRIDKPMRFYRREQILKHIKKG